MPMQCTADKSVIDVTLDNDTYCSMSEPLNNLLSLLLLVSAASGLVNFLLSFYKSRL